MGWFVSAVLGSVIAFFSSGLILPLVFGTRGKSWASLWGLSGVADFLIGFLCLPAFLLAHGVIYSQAKKSELSTFFRASRSLVLALFVFWVVIVLVWYLNGGSGVWRAK